MITDHQAIIQLIIAYTLVGAFIFTVAITCLSLVGWVRFADSKQQNRLFLVLIIELVTIGLGSFSSFLQFNPGSVSNQIETKAIVNMQERIGTLLDKVDTLSDQRAFELASSLPTSSPQVEQLIEAVDPENLRVRNAAAAKKTLKMRIVYMRREPEEVKVWEKALGRLGG